MKTRPYETETDPEPIKTPVHKTVLDEIAQQLKDEFFEGLDFHQLNRLVKNKKQVLEYLEQLSVASQK
jgi:hypothetical protein